MSKSGRWITVVVSSAPLLVAALITACTDAPAVDATTSPTMTVRAARGTTSGPTVTGVIPSVSKRDTTVDVLVVGTGFDSGSRVAIELNGSPAPGIHVNQNRYVSPTELVANVTIDAGAALDLYDVAVTTALGKKGIGTESFEVVPEIGTAISLSTSSELLGQAIHVSDAGYVLGVQDTAVLATRGFGYWFDLTFFLVDQTTQLVDLDGGNSLGDITQWGQGTISLSTNAHEPWTTIVLSKPAGASSVFPYDLNDNRVVVGRGGGQALVWRSPSAPAEILNLPSVPGTVTNAYAKGINSQGDIVGSVQFTSKRVQYESAVLWKAGTASPFVLPTVPDFGVQRAVSINDSGVIVGFVDACQTASCPVRWNPNGSGGYTVTVLSLPTHANATAGLDHCGRMVGEISGKAAIWNPDGSVQYLPSLPGAESSRARSINGSGIVVGYSSYKSTKGQTYKKPTLWRDVPPCP